MLQLRLGPLAAALLAIAAIVAAPSSAAAAPRIEVWVSPTGSDAGPGTKAEPFATLTRARDAVRAAREGSPRTPAVVTLLDGTHRLRRPLRLDARDARTRWRAAPGARPVLSGSRRVTGWRLHDPERSIYRARVGDVRSRQLYVDGRRAVRARGADDPEGFVRTDLGYTAPDAAMASWRNPGDVELVTVTQWKSMRCPVGSIEGAQIAMRQPCWHNANVFPEQWSFRLISWIENAYELLDEPGEWYLDEREGWLYYRPRAGERMDRVTVELPVLQRLVEVRGTRQRPVRDVRFEGVSFTGATWLRPSSDDGYVADQGGFHLVGPDHLPNVIGHDPDTVGTPGAVRVRFAHGVVVRGGTFARLGAVGLELGRGTQGARVVANRFEDISGAAVQVGGVARHDHHPTHRRQVTRDNAVTDNVIRDVGREYFDAPGIAIGFTTRSTVAHNDISDVPWAGIAVGWGWGLLDPGWFEGAPNADQMSPEQRARWGVWDTPTTSRGNRIVANRIHRFLMRLWDGGAIYTLGRQGDSLADGELLARNVAYDKRPAAGGNVFYTDGGSRYVTLRENVSLDNPPGTADFGPCLPSGTDLAPLCELTGKLAYGSDRGGCRPYGDLAFVDNYLSHPDFYLQACPYPPYPVDVTEEGTRQIGGRDDVPQALLDAAGPRVAVPRPLR